MINALIIDNSEKIKPVSFSTVANIALYTDDVGALNAVEKKTTLGCFAQLCSA